jgi:hypothetical protein
MQQLDELREHGRMKWIERDHGWLARPDDVVDALSREGFEEYKRAITTSPWGREATGGVWQGLNRKTGAVASAIWVNRTPGEECLVFIDVDGKPIEGGQDWWAGVDEAILRCLEEAGGALAPVEIGRRLGMSEEATRSALTLLAQEGKVRISHVELPGRGESRRSDVRWQVA